jgi:hypothetical protein
MVNPSNEEIVRRYLAAHEQHDGATMAALRAPEWTGEMPQSGELIRGHANERAIMANWPGGRPEAQAGGHLVGSEDHWVLTPSWIYQRVNGQGDAWWADAVARYPDGSTWHAVILLELHGGKVIREVWYFGPPLEAPAWRAQWVERIPREPSPER